MAAIQDIPLKTINGGDAKLGDYQGKVLLVVNVASKCGLTPQYEGLESLYSKYKDQGLEVLGFPANDFAGQEPGTDAEIADFCRSTYSVDFPMFSKIAVTGDDTHPLYRELTQAKPDAKLPEGSQMAERLASRGMGPKNAGDVMWNFEKFLIGRDGEVADRFSPDTKPDDPALVGAIERELHAGE